MTRDSDVDLSDDNDSGFSWYGLFFGPFYYAGYGEFRQAIFISVCSVIPFVGLMFAFYCGFSAKKDLPMNEAKFDWKYAFYLLPIYFVVGSISKVLWQIISYRYNF